jgi:hypothetical protein
MVASLPEGARIIHMNEETEQYIAALETALAAAIVDLYSNHAEACVATFTQTELMAVLAHVQTLAEDATLEQLYAEALHHSHCNIK